MKVVFRKIWNKNKWVYGECEYGKLISINLLSRANPALTFLHELLHWFHPDWSETKVIQETSKRWKKMTTKRRFELYKELFNRRFRGTMKRRL